jgi:predicted transcriptional regulator
MLVEIPDPEIILGVVAAFFVGLFGLYLFNKIKASTNQQERHNTSSFDRLEYYERQLIDMKIRLDSMEISGEEGNLSEIRDYGQRMEQTTQKEYNIESKTKRAVSKPHLTPKMDTSSTVDFVLRLITNKSMTSRDIQNASQRSREHTSRLMKKLYQDGFVERNTTSKPFTYSITNKGKVKIGVLESVQNMAA